MPERTATQEIQEIPLKIVGGTRFGRYPKISVENTTNMIISDGALVPYSGWKNVISVESSSLGRALYASFTGDLMIAVIGNGVYRIIQPLIPTSMSIFQSTLVGSLATSEGDVYIAENTSKQICITDSVNIYVYNYDDGTFKSSAPGGGIPTWTTFFPNTNPGYISFQNGRLIIALENTQRWVLSAFNDALTWSDTAPFVGTLQSKPCTIKAVVPVPGGGNNVLVFGTTVAESWQDLGLALFPYQRNSTFNLDYGCLNASSIAELDNFVVWLGANEQSGPTIMVTGGNGVQSISTDGIDFVLAQLTNPTNCTGFLFRQDGHLLYQFSFPDDNITFAYDFNNKEFSTITDDTFNYHPAREVVFFNGSYYFVSLKDGNIYQFDTKYTNAIYSDDDIREIPRVRITPPLRFNTQRYFIGKSLAFTIENGEKNIKTTTTINANELADTIATEVPATLLTEDGFELAVENSEAFTYSTLSEAVDLSISRDGGQTFGNAWRNEMNLTGNRKSRFIYQRLGIANDASFLLQFCGFGRFVVFDGIVEAYE